jgi:NADPH:quinone reductase-like Zn-dependent oxidoreductase
MQAFVMPSYGSPDLGRHADVDRPVPAAGEALVRVRATSINPYDWHFLRGEPRAARLMPGMGLRRPRYPVLGCDMAGTVEAVGDGVTRFGPGDDVYALLPSGGFAEYVTVAERLLAAKPANLSPEQAAAVPMAAVTALVGLRDNGRIQPGQQVLVNGASGGVGTFAVQLARAFGAEVVGVPQAQRRAGAVAWRERGHRLHHAQRRAPPLVAMRASHPARPSAATWSLRRHH